MKTVVRNGIEIVPISRGKYQVGTCRIEYYRNARYDTFDGKYHPGWIVYTQNGQSFNAIDKEAAISIALRNQ